MLHWTLSCGPSVCESSNFYIDMGKTINACVTECEDELYDVCDTLDEQEDEALLSFCQARLGCCSAIRDMMDL